MLKLGVTISVILCSSICVSTVSNSATINDAGKSVQVADSTAPAKPPMSPVQLKIYQDFKQLDDVAKRTHLPQDAKRRDAAAEVLRNLALEMLMPELLDALPYSILTTSIIRDFEHTRQMIKERIQEDKNQAWMQMERARDAAVRDRESFIVKEAQEGKYLNPFEASMITYKDETGKWITRSHPALFEFAQLMNNLERFDPISSQITAHEIEEKLRVAFSSGDFSIMKDDVRWQSIVGTTHSPTDTQVMRYVENADLNRTEKMKLLNALPSFRSSSR